MGVYSHEEVRWAWMRLRNWTMTLSPSPLTLATTPRLRPNEKLS